MSQIRLFHSLKAFLIIAIAFTLGAIPTNAQKRALPVAHLAQHETLMANITPFALELNRPLAEKNRQVEERRKEIEQIYSTCWNSQSVNPYGNTPVPDSKDLDISEGVVPVKGAVTSRYGWRPKFGRMHRGVDLSLRVGDSVRVAFSGKVRVVRTEPNGYGNYVVVRHDNGMETVYGHLSKFLVKPNQEVKAGDVIALGGNTGRSTGPHLHFETRYMGLAVNPEWVFDFSSKEPVANVFTFSRSSYDRAQGSKGVTTLTPPGA